MALITRVARLFRADMHAVLDRIEEPDVLLKQSVREMEEIATQELKKLRLIQHEIKQIDSNLEHYESVLKALQEELDICFDANNKDLAKLKIKRYLEIQRNHKMLETKRSRLDESSRELKQRIEDNNTRLNSIRRKVEIIESRDTYEKERGNSQFSPPYLDTEITDEDIEVEYLRLCKKRSKS